MATSRPSLFSAAGWLSVLILACVLAMPFVLLVGHVLAGVIVGIGSSADLIRCTGARTHQNARECGAYSPRQMHCNQRHPHNATLNAK